MTRYPLFVLLMLCAALARADEGPRWEIGAGLAALNLPHYRGADQRSSFLLPMPYLIYRGEHLRADREGVRGILFEAERVQVNLSVNGTLPVKSSDNAARSGMDSLRPTVQLGPTLNMALWRSDDRSSKLEFRLPLRSSVTVASSPRHIGWLVEPTLAFSRRDMRDWPGWQTRLSAGLLFADARYHDYFYSVDAPYATADRPAYQASSGYSGAHLTWTLTKRFPQYWIGTFVRYDTLAGAVIDSSPLVRQRQNVSAGFAFAWIFGRSSERVRIAD